MNKSIYVFRRSCENIHEAIRAYQTGIPVVCGRCKTPIIFILEDAAPDHGGYCSAYCPKDESHVKRAWSCLDSQPFWEGFKEEVARIQAEHEQSAAKGEIQTKSTGEQE